MILKRITQEKTKAWVVRTAFYSLWQRWKRTAMTCFYWVTLAQGADYWYLHFNLSSIIFNLLINSHCITELIIPSDIFKFIWNSLVRKMCFIKEQHLKYAPLLAYWVFTTVSNTMLLFKEKLSCNNHNLCRREKALWILYFFPLFSSNICWKFRIDIFFVIGNNDNYFFCNCWFEKPKTSLCQIKVKHRSISPQRTFHCNPFIKGHLWRFI